MMNQYVARKLGEVLAFCRVGQETFDKGEEGFRTIHENYDEIVSQLGAAARAIEEAVTDEQLKSTMFTKAEGTGQKLESMRDLYIADQWDNVAELCEWSGFFEGAAIIHWQLIAGAAEAGQLTNLQHIAQIAIDRHRGLLDQAGRKLIQIGKEKYLAA